jgi:hypothetical protein
MRGLKNICLRDQGYDTELHGNKIFDNATVNSQHNYTKQSDSGRPDEYSKQKNYFIQDYDRSSRNINYRGKSGKSDYIISYKPEPLGYTCQQSL